MTLTLLTKLDRHDNRTPPPLATEELHRVASQLGLDVNELQQSMKGGFGSVFIAEDHGLSRRVAIKILYKDWKPERMRREIVALRTFCSNESLHSHLIAIYSCFETEHYFCYTMECADNCAPAGAEYKPDSLSNRITQQDKPPSTDEIAAFFHQLLDAVEFLHSQKLVHLDIKPDNILFVKDKLKLADYSLITSMDDVIEKSCGTSGFVPPNQRHDAKGGLDGMDQDLYALGVVLHCYAENSLMWDGVSSFSKELQSQPFYKKMNRFLLKACNACESERFHNVSELRKGFDACFPQKKHWGVMLAACVPLVLLLVVLGLQMTVVMERKPEDQMGRGSHQSVNIEEALEHQKSDDFVSRLLDKHESFPENSDAVARSLFYGYPDAIVEKLVDKKANVNAAFMIPDYIRSWKNGYMAQFKEGQKVTALWLAVAQERPKIVDLLLRNGADANWKDEYGKTVKDLACSKEIRQTLQAFGLKAMATDLAVMKQHGTGAGKERKPTERRLEDAKPVVTLEERLALARKELAELSKNADAAAASAELLEDKRFGRDVEWMMASFDNLKASLRKIQIRELEKQMVVCQRARNLDVSKFSEEATAEFQRRFKEYTIKRYWGGGYQKDKDFSLWVVNELKKGLVNPNVEVVDSSYKEYSGPLLSCIFSGRIEQADEIARELLKLGANSDVRFSEPHRLLNSIAWNVVLEEGGIDRMGGFLLLVLGFPDFYRLCWPQRDSHLEDLAARLICLKHNLVERDHQGNAALHYAAKIGSARLVALMLLEGADVNATNKAGETPLHLALKYGHLQLEPLLLKEGADASLKTIKGETADDYRKAGIFLQNIEKKNYEAVRKALENGMNPNLGRGDNITILHNACRENDVELAKLLLEFNADIELAGTMYPLTLKPIAWAFKEKSLEVFELLLEKGADPNVNVWGDHRELYYLLPQLCEPNRYILKKDMEKSLRWLRALMNARKPPRLFMNNGEPVIKLALAYRRDDAFVSLLLDKYESFQTGSDVIAMALFREYPDSIVERFIEKKADTNAIFMIPNNSRTLYWGKNVKQPFKAGQKTTALWLAVAQDRPKIVGLLLRNGADVNWKDENGKTVRDLSCSPEIHQILQSAGLRAPGSDGAKKEASGNVLQKDFLYVVVDLSGGPIAESYPVRYTNEGPNLKEDKCRTIELWLRKIPKGMFMMGSPEDEVGHKADETLHPVTLTHDYYMGVFECTQKQWELVMGSRPSYCKNNDYYAVRPVEQVSYNNIRGIEGQAGAGWPTSGHTVDKLSFMGKLQAKTGLAFDLPTEAQWEYACRAGTTTALNSGKNLTNMKKDSVINEVARYWYNGGSGFSPDCAPTYGTAKVGSYLPNAWGLYDMHGNVHEWCLDWYGIYRTDAVEEPVGPKTGSTRVLRDSYYGCGAQNCRSAWRYSLTPSDCYFGTGFRVACHQ